VLCIVQVQVCSFVGCAGTGVRSGPITRPEETYRGCVGAHVIEFD